MFVFFWNIFRKKTLINSLEINEQIIQYLTGRKELYLKVWFRQTSSYEWIIKCFNFFLNLHLRWKNKENLEPQINSWSQYENETSDLIKKPEKITTEPCNVSKRWENILRENTCFRTIGVVVIKYKSLRDIDKLAPILYSQG